MKRKAKIRVPSLDEMYGDVVAFVKEYQGKKGYIDVQPALKLDGITCFVFEDETGCGEEKNVYGVRVADSNGADDLQVCFESFTRTYGVKYRKKDFMEAEWMSVRWSDVYYVPTIFSIADNIEEYA